jgi:hypothetical protein
MWPIYRVPAEYNRTPVRKDDSMIFTLATYTVIHVVISLVGIASGLMVVLGLIVGKELHPWTEIFLVTTIAASVTGFGFPFDHLLPSHIVGCISLVVLAVAIYALHGRHLAGAWRRIYVITAVIALYLNVFVLVVQAFRRVPALAALAPTQTELPFLLVQFLVLDMFITLGAIAAIKFRD